MAVIEQTITATLPIPAAEICRGLLQTERWSEFTGYLVIPGIKSAAFELKTPEVLGSRIKVYNLDGSTHVEEIIEWDLGRKVALKFGEFGRPLSMLAEGFVEEWRFQPTDTGSVVTRSIRMTPTGLFGWLLLWPISLMMKQAFARQLAGLARA